MTSDTSSPRKGDSPVPATKRMAALRDRRRKAGQTPMEVWAHPDDHQAIRDEAARLAKARDAAANAKAVGLDAAGGQSHTSDGLCHTGDK